MAQFLRVIQRRRDFSMLLYSVGKRHDSCVKQQRKAVFGRKKGRRKALLKDYIGKEKQ